MSDLSIQSAIINNYKQLDNINEQTPGVNEQGKTFRHVFQETCGDTFFATTENGYIGGLANHINTAESMVNLLNENQYIKVAKNTDLPKYLSTV